MFHSPQALKVCWLPISGESQASETPVPQAAPQSRNIDHIPLFSFPLHEHPKLCRVDDFFKNLTENKQQQNKNTINK